ncbi:MAG: glycosyltransferase family 4 protein, partial [Patescibacteria group bacterium]
LGPFALWIQTLTFVLNLRRRLRDIAPDVTYSRELYTFGFGSVPGLHVWEAHALPSSDWAWRIIRSLDRIVTLTSASKERLVAKGVSADRILVEPDAVDPALFDAAPSREDARHGLDIGDDEFLCLYTGKFTTMNMPKGVDESVAAVRALRSEGRKVRLLAVGGTPEELGRYTSSVGDGIEFLGHQPQKDLKRFYAAADLLLMPFPYTKHYAYFMSPLKLFEYLMSGVPMVVTDLQSVREIVGDAEAFIAKPGDVASLVVEIRRAMDAPEDARARADAAWKLSSKYTWTERARRIAAWLPTSV